jgi:hypothetical protein
MPERDAHHGPDGNAHPSGRVAFESSVSSLCGTGRSGPRATPHIMHSTAPSGTGSRQCGQRSGSSSFVGLRRKNRIVRLSFGVCPGCHRRRDSPARPCIKRPIRRAELGPKGRPPREQSRRPVPRSAADDWRTASPESVRPCGHHPAGPPPAGPRRVGSSSSCWCRSWSRSSTSYCASRPRRRSASSRGTPTNVAATGRPTSGADFRAGKPRASTTTVPTRARTTTVWMWTPEPTTFCMASGTRGRGVGHRVPANRRFLAPLRAARESGISRRFAAV